MPPQPQPQSPGDTEAALSNDTLACAQLLRQLLTQLQATTASSSSNKNKRPRISMSIDEGDEPSSQRQAPARDVQSQSQSQSQPTVAVTSTAANASSRGSRKTPRTRALLACHECRHRKVKCDGAKPVCGSCQARGRRYTCSYALLPETEKKRDVFGYIDRLEHNLLQSRQYQQGKEVSDTQEKGNGAFVAAKPNGAIYNGCHNDNRNDNGNNNHIDTCRDGINDNYDTVTPIDPISHDGRSKHPTAYIEELSASERAQIRHHRSFGSSSTMNFMAQVQNLPAVADLPLSYQEENQSPSSISGYFSANIEEQRTKHPSMLTQPIGASPMISPSLMQQLLDTYFNHVHCLHPYLHRPTWQGKQRAEALINGVADPDTGDDNLCACMVNLVFALGALYCVDLPVDKALHISETFFLKAKKAITIEQLETPSLELAQILLLMTQYSMERCLHQRGHLHASLIYISLAIRVCQSLGLHQNSTKMIGYIVREVTKRVWWGCVYFDWSLSVYFGQPSSISSHQYDTDLPLAVDDEMILRDNILTQEPGTFPKTAFFVYGLQLAQVLESINGEIYDTIGKRPPQFSVAIENGDFTILKRLESALLDWHGSLPEELRAKKDGYDSLQDRNWVAVDRQAIVLHLRYQYALVLLYRPCLSRLLECLRQGQSPSIYSSTQRSPGSFWHTTMAHHADACVNVAVETINFVHVNMNFEGASPSLFKGSTWGLYYVYSMISVLIAAKCCHLQDDLSAAVFYKAWDQVIDILRAYRSSTQPTEIPFRFLESIDRHLFRATRDKTPPQTQMQSPPPVEITMPNRRETPGVIEPWDPLPAEWLTQTLSPSWDELGLHWLDTVQAFDHVGGI